MPNWSLETSISKSERSENFICTELSVRKLIARFEETGSVHDLPRTGRPRIHEGVVQIV